MMVSLIRGLSRDLSIKAGLRAAYLSLRSSCAVSEELSPSFLTEESVSEWAGTLGGFPAALNQESCQVEH